MRPELNQQLQAYLISFSSIPSPFTEEIKGIITRLLETSDISQAASELNQLKITIISSKIQDTFPSTEYKSVFIERLDRLIAELHAPINDLPTELLTHIYSFLPLKEKITVFPRVNHRFKQISDADIAQTICGKLSQLYSNFITPGSSKEFLNKSVKIIFGFNSYASFEAYINQYYQGDYKRYYDTVFKWLYIIFYYQFILVAARSTNENIVERFLEGVFILPHQSTSHNIKEQLITAHFYQEKFNKEQLITAHFYQKKFNEVLIDYLTKNQISLEATCSNFLLARLQDHARYCDTSSLRYIHQLQSKIGCAISNILNPGSAQADNIDRINLRNKKIVIECIECGIELPEIRAEAEKMLRDSRSLLHLRDKTDSYFKSTAAVTKIAALLKRYQ